MREIIHDSKFDSWDQEKRYKVSLLQKTSQSVIELTEFLAGVGVRGDSTHGKINAILQMLLDTGVINEKDLLDMELNFALGTEEELKEVADKVRNQAKLAGVNLNQRKSSGLIVPGR